MLKKFLFELFRREPQDDFIGVLPDNRTQAEKDKDWQADELASSSSVSPAFRTVKENEWAKYTIRDQNGSGSCVSQALAKGMEVLYKKKTGKTVVFSATPIYQKRKNRPDAGMYIHDAFDIVVKNGTCPEANCKSQLMDDDEMDATPIPSNFNDLNDMIDAVAYASIPRDFDYIAGWVEKHGYAQLHIAADRKSWSRDFPRIGSLNRGVRHAIAVVDAVTFEGKQYLVIEDSWGEFGEFTGQRLISRSVFNDMYTSAAGFTVLEYDVTHERFGRFDTRLEIGDRNPEVVRLQDYLKSRGFFPINVDSTGYYGNVTALAVYNFQMARQVASPVILNKYKGKYCHEATLRAINADL